ncbi:hypothetical protein CBF86_10540 [Limosilactobacillus reuteri]|uniref:hypothetical protein n=1 Tax=Limosilactobacillus reuteri TaxID=1598 RepID=UPI000B97F0EA|nr:hypothetical protein [Limosilactobacillus reuteri]OYS45434.1 hypothetical protein CBF86_10540 [Limosilactobacillus reuteri]OYS47581.1 hypothetical protein CBF84_09410 [Limosilactobacillus reuteri]OYS53093.1 hypothetical protein CBF92_06990 [Limosilactobacillus reuteri]OYS53566.1 hypothetical protein CBF95_09505 [Limosilactobacillus reuteri]OYS62471.1 hypothetical protein CBF93_03235 [Limosilactobacillus reuteri]
MGDLRFNGLAQLIVALGHDVSPRLKKLGEGFLYWSEQFPKEKQMLQSQARFHSIGEMIANKIDQEILNECKFENNIVEKSRRSSQDFRKFVRTL